MAEASRSPRDHRDCTRQPRDAAGKVPNEQPKGRPSARGRPRETIMTPETQQARAGYHRPDIRGRGGATTTRSGALATEAVRTGDSDAAAQPSPAAPPLTARAKRAREDASIVG